MIGIISHSFLLLIKIVSFVGFSYHLCYKKIHIEWSQLSWDRKQNNSNTCLQPSQVKGRKSSWLQSRCWQCLPKSGKASVPPDAMDIGSLDFMKFVSVTFFVWKKNRWMNGARKQKGGESIFIGLVMAWGVSQPLSGVTRMTRHAPTHPTEQNILVPGAQLAIFLSSISASTDLDFLWSKNPCIYVVNRTWPLDRDWMIGNFSLYFKIQFYFEITGYPITI